jgi:osmotically-inducible protein OsmY
MPYYWTRYPYPHYYWARYGPYFKPITRSDAEIGTDVVNALRGDPWVDASNIEVAVDNGAVILKGTVPNLFQKRQAGDDTWDVPGVVDLHNDLVITS